MTHAGPRGFFPADKVLAAAQGRWTEVLGSLGVRTEYLTGRHGPCPGCGGRDRFRFDDLDGNGSFICSQGGGGNLSGNGLTLLQHCLGWDWKTALEQVGRLLLSDNDRIGWSLKTGVTTPLPGAPVLPPEPLKDRVNIPPYDEEKLREYVRGMEAVTREDLKRLSPIPVEKGAAGDFFETLYDTGERLLVFTEFESQGQFLYQVGAGSCRLGRERGVKAVESPLPMTGRNGVWFLSNPVNGNWMPDRAKTYYRTVPKGYEGPAERIAEPAEWKRRKWFNVTSFRYAVIESDVAPENLWLRALVKMPLPIAAIYSSGGKSLHALIRVDAQSKEHWDIIVRGVDGHSPVRHTSVMTLACPLGADANALSAVRLTRLPFCYREGSHSKEKGYVRYGERRLQELVYLNPQPFNKPVPWKSIEVRHGSGRR